jgi:hypothetical protein
MNRHRRRKAATFAQALDGQSKELVRPELLETGAGSA